MDKGDRVRACYHHASLRQRLGIKDSNYPMASRIIRDSVDAKLVKAYTKGSESKKDASYVPFWA